VHIRSADSTRLELRNASEAADIAALSEKDVGKQIKLLEKQMLEYARDLQFEKAAQVRDQLARFKQIVVGAAPKKDG
jgi:excinuclease ABC subunit B